MVIASLVWVFLGLALFSIEDFGCDWVYLALLSFIIEFGFFGLVLFSIADVRCTEGIFLGWGGGFSGLRYFLSRISGVSRVYLVLFFIIEFGLFGL